MAETETVRRILVSGRSEGLDKLSSELNKIRDAHEGVAEAAEDSAKATEKSATVTETSARRMLSPQGAWDKLIAKNYEAVRATQRFEQEMDVLNRTLAADPGKLGAVTAEVERLKRSLEAVGGRLAQGSPGLDAFLGVGRVPKGRDDTVAIFEAQTRELEAAAQRRLAAAKKVGADLDALLISPAAKKGKDSEAAQSAKVFVDDLNARTAAVQRLQQQFDPLTVAQERHTKAVAEANKLLAAGDLTQKSHTTIVANSAKILNDTTKSYEGAFTAQNKFASGTGLARHELVNLSRQAQDVFVSLSSGQSPLTVLIQQGTQIADVFATSRGSVGGFFTQFLSWVAPMVPALTAATVAVVALYSAFQVASQKQELSNSLLGTGRVAGVTGVELNKLAVIAAESAEMTAASARSIAGEFAKTGKVGIDNMTMLIKLTKDYSNVTGMTLNDAAKEIAAGLMDTSRGLETATQRLGPLDSTTQSAARSAESFGDKLKANKLYLDAVKSATEGAETAQSNLNRAWNLYIAQPVAAATEKLAGAILPTSDADKREADRAAAMANVARLERQLAQDRRSNNAEVIRYSEQGLARAKATLKALEDAAAVETKSVQAKAQAVQADGKINVAAALAQSTMKEELTLRLQNAAAIKNNAEALEELNKKRGILATQRKPNGDLVDPEKFAEVNRQIKEITASQEKLKNQAAGQAQVTEGLTAQQQKSIDLLKVEEKYRGSLSISQRLAAAGETMEIENRDKLTSTIQKETDVRIAQKKIVNEAANAHVTENQRAEATISTFERQIEILRAAGVEKAKIADFERRAKEGARVEGVDESVVLARILRSEAAQARAEVAAGNAERRVTLELSKDVNKASAGGVMSATQRSRLEAELRVEKEIIAKLDATGVVSQKDRNKAVAEGVALVKAQNSEAANTAADNYMFGQLQQIEAQRKQIDLLKVSRGERYEELEVMKAQQYLQEQGISAESDKGKKILENAKLIGQQNREYDTQLRIQRQIQQAQEFAADNMKTFLGDLLTGTEGLTGALKNLGKSFLNSSLDALISGKGPLAGITGLASADKDGQGGILGMFTKGLQNLGKDVQTGAKKGSAEGTVAGFSVIGGGSSDGFLSGLGINGKDLAGGLTAIAGLAGAYGSGMAASSYGQAVAGGALSGGMAGLALAGTGIGASLGGAAVLGPIGLIVGGALAYYGQKSAREAAKKKREEEAQENYRQAQPAIATMRSQLRGESQDTLANRIQETLNAVTKLMEVAFFAKKYDEERAIATDFNTYKSKAIADFQLAFGGIIDSMMDGLGPNSAFSTARESIKSTGDTLKGLISDAAYAFGEAAPQIEQAREAAKVHALSILDGSKSLSVVATRMEEVRGASVALQTLLVELGMSATDAAMAIEQDAIAALDRVRGVFRAGLVEQVNEVEGVGYINEVQALLVTIAGQKADATLLGTLATDGPLIERHMRGAAQAIVDSAQLTGEAFEKLLAAIPELNGYVHEFTGTLDAAGRAADIAARKLAAMDRLFAATNPTDTLEGQLAAYNRRALREREAETKAGGEAMAELEAAQAAERYNIIRDWNQKILDDQKRAADEASAFWSRISKQIKEYTDGLRAGTASPLSPQQRLAAAQSQYEAQMALAKTGDRDALGGITGYHKDFIDALRDFWGSSETFQDLWASSITDLEQLPELVRPEDLIVAAIEAGAQQTVDAIAMMQTVLKASVDSGSAQQTAIALQQYFDKLDVNTDNALSYAEFITGLGPLATKAEQTAAKTIFDSIDSNGDGQISRLEQVHAAAGAISPPIVAANNEAIRVQLLALAEISSKTGSTATYTSWIVPLVERTAAIQSAAAQLSGYAYVNRMNLQAANQRVINGGSSAAVASYAQGGYTGPGGVNEFGGIVHKGEIVWSQSDINRFGGVAAVEALRANDNMQLPDAALPALMNGNSDGAMAALLSRVDVLVAEVQTSRVENSRGHTQTARATLAGADQVREGVDELQAAQDAAVREQRRKRA